MTVNGEISGAGIALRDPVEYLDDLLYRDECRRYIDAILIHNMDAPVPVNPDQFREELRQLWAGAPFPALNTSNCAQSTLWPTTPRGAAPSPNTP